MKKCLIVCWYGKFPDYFKLWEKTCSMNVSYDFFVFTDQKYVSKYKNIKIINIKLNDINKLFSQKLDINIEIKKAYKLCDFRPAYGIVFEDYIKGYDYWGHCDIDQLFGNIDDFITEDILQECEKINKNGHFVLYKNNEKMNNLFKREGSIFNYIDVFKNDENYAFDEYTGINEICKKQKIITENVCDFIDIDVKYKRYRDVNFKNYSKQVFTWENGKIFKYYFENNRINKVEYMYLHFQKKKPKIYNLNFNENKIVMGKRGIDIFDNEISIDDIIKFNKFNGQIYEKFEYFRYYLLKVIAFIKCNKKQKNIWILQKRIGIKE